MIDFSRWRTRRLITSAVLVALLAAAALVFRRPLKEWFSGSDERGPAQTASRPKASAGSAAEPGAPMVIRPIQYPPVAFDAMRGAMDASDRIRADLSRDEPRNISEAARSVSEALRAAENALPNDRDDVRHALSHASSAAEAMGRGKAIQEMRKALAEYYAHFLPLIGADPRLTQGWRVFECPMFENARWMQRSAAPENPYMGTKMLTCATASDWQAKVQGESPGGTTPDAIDHYTCSMHPSVNQPGPGKCPICGMDLIPVTKAQVEQGVVLIDAARQQLIGVRTGRVIQAPMRWVFRAVGQVTYDESKLADVNLKVQGWVTKLFVNQTGQRVKAGQPLLLVYSPELYGAQQDFLLATQGGSAPGTRVEVLARAARQRLHLLGLSDGQIDAVAKKGAPLEGITISSPASGFVIEKNVVEGASVDPGMRLFRIAALNKVWVEAEVYEGDLPQARVGQSATVTLDYLPGHSYEAKVAYVYPYLDPKSRTGRVRVELANNELDLRPGMYASVELASEPKPRVQVPASAVVYTGPRRIVFVDLGEGRFRPQEVQVGMEADGMYEVLSGLSPGDVVATSGTFLIAAEARIRTAAKYGMDLAPVSSTGKK
ncbi:MAG TPA: efflux RND transporter periplasmic adaptor subunit [Polyangiaceae bacterium]